MPLSSETVLKVCDKKNVIAGDVEEGPMSSASKQVMGEQTVRS